MFARLSGVTLAALLSLLAGSLPSYFNRANAETPPATEAEMSPVSETESTETVPTLETEPPSAPVTEVETPPAPPAPEVETPPEPSVPEVETPTEPSVPEVETPPEPPVTEVETPEPPAPEVETPEPSVPEVETPPEPPEPEVETPEPSVPEVETPPEPPEPEVETPPEPPEPEVETPPEPSVPEVETPPEPPPSSAIDWQEFKTDRGNFSIDFPGNPTEQIDPADLETGDLETGAYIWESADFLMGYAAFYKVLNGTPNEEQAISLLDLFLKDFVANAVVNGTLLEEKEIAIAGNPGREIEVQGTEGYIKARVYLAGDRLYLLTAVAPNQEMYSSESDRFFESFKLR